MRILFLLCFSLLLASVYISGLTGCAQVQPLTGGERDTIPPQLDTLASTPNFQVNFKKQPLLLTFDEFIDLKDVFNQVVVSPPLAKPPKVTLEKYRKVRFEFDEEEVLRPEATYSIQFGDAIKDFTEGNASPIRYVFSTGAQIDSLRVKGQVVDAYTGKPVEKVLVMLYDNLADSVVRTERPFYFARTDKQGNFLIENVKPDTFKVFALEDANLNYLYDLTTERIGFPENFVVASDSLSEPVSIRFSLETPPLLLSEKTSPLHGLVKLTFNREPWELTYAADPPVFFEETIQDTLFLWHELPDTLSPSIYLQTGDQTDTLIVRPTARTAAPQKIKPEKSVGEASRNPVQPITLRFNYPLKTVYLDSIQVWQDTIQLEARVTGSIDSTHLRTLHLRFDWQEGQSYRMLLPPGTLRGWKDTVHDSLSFDFRISPRKDFSGLKIQLDSLDTVSALVVELMQQDKVADRFIVPAGTETWEKTLTFLTPGAYQLRVTKDLNGNGRWDPASYEQRLQPERQQIFTIEPLRANWDVEAKFEVKW